MLYRMRRTLNPTQRGRFEELHQSGRTNSTPCQVATGDSSARIASNAPKLVGPEIRARSPQTIASVVENRLFRISFQRFQ